MDLDDINEELGTDLESENSETIGGLILDILGEIPDENDVGTEVEYENYRFRIDSIKDRRIEKVTMTVLPAEETTVEDEEKCDRSERHERREREKREKREKKKESTGK